MEVETASMGLDIERDVITMWTEFIHRNANICRKRSAKNDEEGVVIEVRWVVNDIRIVGIQIKPEVSEFQVQEISERRKGEILWGRATAPIINKINEQEYMFPQNEEL